MSASLSTTSLWLRKATRELELAGIHTARLDCLILLEDATEKDRAWILANPDHTLTATQLKRLKTQLTHRKAHLPLAYIRGKTEFYGREMYVNKHTLEPRPETETIIDLMKRLPINKGGCVIDVGTGSGCIAITAKLERPMFSVHAVDIAAGCLKTAQQNAAALGADVTFYRGNLLEPVSHLLEMQKHTVILANLPYVPSKYALNQAATFEPKRAIFGGMDGLDVYRDLFRQIALLPHKPEYILTESLPFQHAELEKIAIQAGYSLVKTDDFIQQFTG